MSLLDTKNAYFDRLFSDPELKWLGQNTNHVPQHPAVAAAMHAAVDAENFHAYAPPAGMEALLGAEHALGEAALLKIQDGVWNQDHNMGPPWGGGSGV